MNISKNVGCDRNELFWKTSSNNLKSVCQFETMKSDLKNSYEDLTFANKELPKMNKRKQK